METILPFLLPILYLLNISVLKISWRCKHTFYSLIELFSLWSDSCFWLLLVIMIALEWENRQSGNFNAFDAVTQRLFHCLLHVMIFPTLIQQWQLLSAEWAHALLFVANWWKAEKRMLIYLDIYLYEYHNWIYIYGF